MDVTLDVTKFYLLPYLKVQKVQLFFIKQQLLLNFTCAKKVPEVWIRYDVKPS